MITVLSESNPKARKHHTCDACIWLLNGDGWNGMGFSISELRSISRAKRNKWKIVPGQKYLRQNNIYDGELYTFKAIPEIDAICKNHDLYDC